MQVAKTAFNPFDNFFVNTKTKGTVTTPKSNESERIAISESPNIFIQKCKIKKYNGVCCKSRFKRLSIMPNGKICFAVNQEQASSYQKAEFMNNNRKPTVTITKNITLQIDK